MAVRTHRPVAYVSIHHRLHGRFSDRGVFPPDHIVRHERGVHTRTIPFTASASPETQPVPVHPGLPPSGQPVADLPVVPCELGRAVYRLLFRQQFIHGDGLFLPRRFGIPPVRQRRSATATAATPVAAATAHPAHDPAQHLPATCVAAVLAGQGRLPAGARGVCVRGQSTRRDVQRGITEL